MYNPDCSPIDMLATKVRGLHDRMDFGKWKHCKVETIIAKEPSYIRWLLANTEHTFTAEVHQALNKVSPIRGITHCLDDDADWFGDNGGFDHGGM